MDKITARERDRAWEEVKIAREKVSLAKMGQQLISLYELGKLWLSLKKHDANCLVLCDDGSIYRGDIKYMKLEKLTRLQESYKTEEHTDLLSVQSDMQSAEEMYPIAFNGVRSSNWDAKPRLANGSRPTRSKKGANTVQVKPMPADDI